MLLIEILDKIVDSDHMTIKEKILTLKAPRKNASENVVC